MIEEKTVLGSLAPDFDAGEAPLEADEALDRFLSWVESTDMELWPHQEDALLSVAAGNHVILGTPTGSGKSMVALGMLFVALCGDYQAYYTAPIKALVSEKFFDLVRVLGRKNVGMITGDSAINTTAPVICCTAEILANQALREGAQSPIAFVAMDEFHYYGDPDRGWAWQVPLLTLPNAQFLLMSATLGNTQAIAESLEARSGRTVDTVVNAPRPVPLAYRFVDTALEASVELALRDDDAPIYIVHFAQDAALKSATSLASFGVSDRASRDAIREAVKGARFTTDFGKTLQRLLAAGVGVHHAGMLPRYRLLVERLAQAGLLPVICGTDTLGVGINVPIHTVLMSALAKFDGHRMRRLNAREFHQIAGRAGRAGFDTEGLVIAEATEYDIERARALRKAGGDAKRARKVKVAKPPEGFVGWNEESFARLIAAEPEPLRPRMRITHSMVLAIVNQGGDAHAHIHQLIDESAQSDDEKLNLHQRADEILATLMDAGVVVREEQGEGKVVFRTTVDVPENFALDQPLSPFLLAAIELLDPDSDVYALDLISLVESTLENPRQILVAQEKQARGEAVARWKAEGMDYEERMERLEEVSYPQPLAELVESAFAQYCEEVPWAGDFEPSPKSILRDMLERGCDFKSYVAQYKIARSEGLLLRYLSDAYRVLSRTVPESKRDERLEDITRWLGLVVRTTDSSLVDEWMGSNDQDGGEVAAFVDPDEVVHDRRALTLLVRNALMRRVVLASRGDFDALGELDAAYGWPQPRWRHAIDSYFAQHDAILTDADARSLAYITIDTDLERSEHIWRVRQIFHDPDDDNDFQLWAEVDLDATQDVGTVVFASLNVGFFEDLSEHYANDTERLKREHLREV